MFKEKGSEGKTLGLQQWIWDSLIHSMVGGNKTQ